ARKGAAAYRGGEPCPSCQHGTTAATPPGHGQVEVQQQVIALQPRLRVQPGRATSTAVSSGEGKPVLRGLVAAGSLANLAETGADREVVLAKRHHLAEDRVRGGSR